MRVYANFLCCIVVLFLLGWGIRSARAQEGAVNRSNLEIAVQEIKNQVGDLSKRIAAQEKDFYETRFYAIAIIASLLGIAGLSQLREYFRSSKEKDREQAISQLLDLFKVGEAEAQKRANELHNVMLREGQTTLGLVNDTLRLATEARKQAVEAVETKLLRLLEHLDDEFKVFLRKFSGYDPKTLILAGEDVHYLLAFAKRLQRIEEGNTGLEREVKLTPSMFFLKGLAQYLEQDYEGAGDFFYKIIEDDAVSGTLKSYSFYWAAHSYNNIGKYTRAKTALQQGLAAVDEVRKIEFRRLLIETHFFAAGDEARIEAELIDLISDAVEQNADKSLIEAARLTYANVLYQRARYRASFGSKEDAASNLKKAVELYKMLPVDLFGARFGLAICYFALNETPDQVKRILSAEVRPEAIKNVGDVEPRCRATASAILLACYKAMEDEKKWAGKIEPTVRSTIDHIHSVRPGVLIYSPFLNKNISIQECFQDIENLYDNGLFRLPVGV
jgi:tetratricopeptide (TPR) repeat protein